MALVTCCVSHSITGIPWVPISETITITANTVPLTGTGIKLYNKVILDTSGLLVSLKCEVWEGGNEMCSQRSQVHMWEAQGMEDKSESQVCWWSGMSEQMAKAGISEGEKSKDEHTKNEQAQSGLQWPHKHAKGTKRGNGLIASRERRGRRGQFA